LYNDLVIYLGRLKKHDHKMTEQIAGVDNIGLENGEPNLTGWKMKY